MELPAVGNAFDSADTILSFEPTYEEIYIHSRILFVLSLTMNSPPEQPKCILWCTQNSFYQNARTPVIGPFCQPFAATFVPRAWQIAKTATPTVEHRERAQHSLPLASRPPSIYWIIAGAYISYGFENPIDLSRQVQVLTGTIFMSAMSPRRRNEVLSIGVSASLIPNNRRVSSNEVNE